MPQTIYASFATVDQAEKAAGALLDYGVQRDDLSLVANGEKSRRQEQEVGAVVPTYVGEPITAGINPNAVGYATPSTIDYSTTSFGGDPLATSSPVDDTRTYPGDLRTGQTNENFHNSGNIDNEDSIVVAKSGITTTTPEDAGVGALKGTEIGLGIGILAGLATLIVPGVGLVLGGGALAAAIGAAALTTGAGAVTGGVVGYLKDQGIGEVDAARFGSAVVSGGALLAVNLPSNGVDLQQAEVVLNKYGATDISSY